MNHTTDVKTGSAPARVAPGPGSSVPSPLADGSSPRIEIELDQLEPPVKAPPTVGRAVLTGVKDAFSPAYRFAEGLGNHLIFAMRAFAWLLRPPFRVRNYLDAAVYIGWASIPIVVLVGLFTGMVMSLQSVIAFRQFGLEPYAAGVTGKAIALELGPVLTSLVLAGRAGAGIATEIGTMRTTEQFDALESMAVNPTQFLITPRIVAAMIVTPILTLLFFIVGMLGAYGVAVMLQNVDHGQWVANLQDITQARDVFQGCIKAVVFGFLFSTLGCYQGFTASGGARGVGIGTTRAVVFASMATLITDYFLSEILLKLMPPLSQSY